MKGFKLFREIMAEMKERQKLEKEKERLLSKEMDYAFLERLIRDINENPLLHVHISLLDGTQIDMNTLPKRNVMGEIIEPIQEMRVIK